MLRIELDKNTNLWYNTRMTTATATISDRIIPRNVYSEHAYAFGFLRGKVQALIQSANQSANDPYYCYKTRMLKIESMILDLESTLKQLESEMYPNDSK